MSCSSPVMPLVRSLVLRPSQPRRSHCGRMFTAACVVANHATAVRSLAVPVWPHCQLPLVLWPFMLRLSFPHMSHCYAAGVPGGLRLLLLPALLWSCCDCWCCGCPTAAALSTVTPAADTCAATVRPRSFHCGRPAHGSLALRPSYHSCPGVPPPVTAVPPITALMRPPQP